MSLFHVWSFKKAENVLIIVSSIFALAIVSLSFSVVQAQEEQKGKGIVFPIVELGNCTDKTSCKSFCDQAENLTACVKFAEEHNFISKEDAQKAKKLADIGVGPGGCTGRACETYCEDTANIDECVAFAEKHNIAPPEELKEMKQVAKALKGGAKLPGGCKDKRSCEAYCAEPENANVCLAFAEKAGFMKKEELEHARKVLPLMARGETPGGCKSREQCEAYCESGEHMDECIAFAEKAGFMSPKEIEMAKKTGGKGPGGCVGRACQNFCNNPANQDVCFAFAREHGLIDEQQLEDIKEGAGRMRMGLETAPPEVRICLKNALGEDVLSNIEAGTLTPSADIGQRAHECFGKFMPPDREGAGINEMNRPHGGEQGTTSERSLNRQPSFPQGVPEEMRACIEVKKAMFEDKVRQGGVVEREEVERSMRECAPRQFPQDADQGTPTSSPRRDTREGFRPPEPARYNIPRRPIMGGREGVGYPIMGSGTVPFDNRGQVMQDRRDKGAVYQNDGQMMRGGGESGQMYPSSGGVQNMPPRDPRFPAGEHMPGVVPSDGSSRFTPPQFVPQNQDFQGGAGMMQGGVLEPGHVDMGGYVAPIIVQ